MPQQHIMVDVADGVSCITLNRPDVLNSFTRDMGAEVREALDAAAEDSAIRAVVLTGAGRAFCAGQDLAEASPVDGLMPDLGDIVRDTYNPMIAALRELEKPVVAAVNGTAAGAGASLAIACDVVLAARDASFIWSFARIGVIPDSGGTFLLPRLVGLQRASALTLLGERITADQAREWGLVWQVTEPGEVLPAAMTMARRLATQPTRGLGLTKRAFNASLGVDLRGQLALEETLQRLAGRTDDYAEGVQAFLAKRPPVFTGR